MDEDRLRQLLKPHWTEHLPGAIVYILATIGLCALLKDAALPEIGNTISATGAWLANNWHRVVISIACVITLAIFIARQE